MKLILKKGERGAGIYFAGQVHWIKSKRVAAKMVAHRRPVWTCRARRGFHVVKLVDAASWHCDQFVKEAEDSLDMVVAVLSRDYLRELEKWVRLELSR